MSARKTIDYLTTAQAAARIGVTPGRVRQIDFPNCVRIGVVRLIPSQEVEKIAEKPSKSGRQRKFLPRKTSGKPAISAIPAK